MYGLGPTRTLSTVRTIADVVSKSSDKVFYSALKAEQLAINSKWQAINTVDNILYNTGKELNSISYITPRKYVFGASTMFIADSTGQYLSSGNIII